MLPAQAQSAWSAQLLAARAQALFTSDLSARCEHTQTEVVATIRRALRAHGGIDGCAAEVAAAYGEHPETAARRMRWARAVIQGIADFEAALDGAARPTGREYLHARFCGPVAGASEPVVGKPIDPATVRAKVLARTARSGKAAGK